jgi:hypothetical protein
LLVVDLEGMIIVIPQEEEALGVIELLLEPLEEEGQPNQH